MSDEFGPASMGTSGASSRRIHWAAVVVSLIVGLGTGGIGGYFMARSHAKVAEASAQGAQTVRRVDGELSGTTSRVEVDLDYVKARREACVDAGAAAAAIAAIIARLQRAVSTSGGGEKQRPVRIDLSRWDDGMADYWSMSATFRRSMAAYRVFFGVVGRIASGSPRPALRSSPWASVPGSRAGRFTGS